MATASQRDAAIVRHWATLRRLRGVEGYTARLVRSVAWRGLQALYRPEAGPALGMAQQLVAATVIWPVGKDE